jgi:hypothetical protein
VSKQDKKPLHKVIVGEFIFWLHTVILSLIIVAGLFISWYWIVLIVVIVRAQQYVFHGCILTILEARENGIKKGMAYYQLAAKRFFGLNLSKKGVWAVSISHNILTFGVVLFANLEHVRLHL